MSIEGVKATQDLAERCRVEVEKVVVGQRAILDGALIALLTGGHVLLEGVPGVAKTLLVRALSAALDCRFRRIQFTPDLMPSDVTGAAILKEGDLVFRPGPIFAHLILGDEINRAPAKTQSALLEAMQERAVTSDGVRHALPELFAVFATQNPIEQEGTYPLPEAELDRFMMKLIVDYPSEDAERGLLERHHRHEEGGELASITKVTDAAGLLAQREIVRNIEVSPGIVDYVTRLVRASRKHLSVAVGVSPRSGLALIRAAKAHAALSGRTFVLPDDLKHWARPVFRHRLVLTPTAEIAGTTPDQVIGSLLESVEVPT
jgi:MoxR-like ATPase